MPLLSLIYPAAREDHDITGLPGLHVFEAMARTLESQTCLDFELIVVDNLHHERKTWWVDRKVPFDVLSVPPKPGNWGEKGRCNLSACYNTGLVHAEGKYVCVINDSGEAPVGFVELLLDWLKKGYRPQVPFVHYYGGYPKVRDEGNAAAPGVGRLADMKAAGPMSRDQMLGAHLQFHHNDLSCDNRYAKIRGEKGLDPIFHNLGNWFWPWASAPLEDFLDLNGYDEYFDGCKSLDDCDLGTRLVHLRGDGKFVLDRNLWFIQHWDEPATRRVFTHGGACDLHTNVPLLQWCMKSKRVRANNGPLGAEAEQYLKTPPPQHSGLYYYQRTGEWSTHWRWDTPDFDAWWKNPPNFDLREQRRRLKAGEDPWTVA